MTDFSRYLIASDIDGTYLGPESAIVERNNEALARFRAGGGLFTLATGRIPCTMEPHIPGLRELINAPAVVGNGAALYDFHEEKASCEIILDQKALDDLMRFLQAHRNGEVYQLSTNRGMFFDGANDRVRRYTAPCRAGTITFAPVAEWPPHIAYKVVLFGDAEHLSALRVKLEERFSDRFEITTSSATLLEIQTRGCTKAVGLEGLRRATAKRGERILIACGDYDNDLEMLKAADISVCPANACDKVKAIADYQLCHCGDGLIADIIERIESGELQVKRKRVWTV